MAAQVDGLGNALTDYEDPNVPSLLSIPLLGYPYNRTIYANTRARILSHENKFFYEGAVRHVGASHVNMCSCHITAAQHNMLLDEREECDVLLPICSAISSRTS